MLKNESDSPVGKSRSSTGENLVKFMQRNTCYSLLVRDLHVSELQTPQTPSEDNNSCWESLLFSGFNLIVKNWLKSSIFSGAGLQQALRACFRAPVPTACRTTWFFDPSIWIHKLYSPSWIYHERSTHDPKPMALAPFLGTYPCEQLHSSQVPRPGVWLQERKLCLRVFQIWKKRK